MAVSQRAQNLANQFELYSNELISVIEQATPQQLQARCAGEQCTVAALGSHVAGVHPLALGWVKTIAAGEKLPALTMDMVDKINAEQTARDANRDKDEILADLRRNGAEATRAVRGLRDDELDRSTHFTLFNREMTTEDMIRMVLIGDIKGHLASIRQAVSA